MGSNGKLEHGAVSSGQNNFQGRYAIRHQWSGPIACKNPVRGTWGGPPGGSQPKAAAATNTAFAARGKLQLAAFVKGPLPDVVALPGAATPLGSPVVRVPPSPPGSAIAPMAPAGSASAASSSSTASVADAAPADSGPNVPNAATPPSRGCGCDVPGVGDPLSAGGALAAVGTFLAALRRRRRTARGER